jgi:superfamily I DNA/RNA helicase
MTTTLRSVDQQTEMFEQTLEYLQEHQRLLTDVMREVQQRLRQGQAGAAGEDAVTREVERVVVDLGQADWRVLVDRKWPGSRGNIDLILVGPPGMIILDAKNWREPRIEGGRLWRGDEPMDDEVEKVRVQGDAIIDALAGSPVTPHHSLSPATAVPMLVLARKQLNAVQLDGVTVLGERNLHAELMRLPRRLDNAGVAAVAEALDVVCPPMMDQRAERLVSVPRNAKPVETLTPDAYVADALLESGEIWRALADAACADPVEAWMTWLHPTQTSLATRSYTGPARVRGVAGSGKTVVALHRARHLSRDAKARVLVTTYVKNLPAVQRSLFDRLSPSTASRVEFTNLHRWALKLLASRGTRVDLGEPGRDHGSALTRAWASSGVARELTAAGQGLSYWRDEIAHVIKGRGLVSLEDYLNLVRVGRKTPLRAEQRGAVWRLYERYQELLAEDEIADYDDVISLALASVIAEPLPEPFTAVIVDEAQDLSCQGMRLLHALVGDSTDGLFIVGDGQQAVYPGGYTLKEAGVTVSGRSTILTRNYRNGSEILRAALEVVSGDDFGDLDTERDAGARAYETERPGGIVRRFPTVDRRSQREELLADVRIQLESGARPGDIALLVATQSAARAWRDTLDAAGTQTQDLETYDGIPNALMKVGTYRRAKGLEFAQVYVPDIDPAITRPADPSASESERELSELERRCLFVAMTRARDRLWLGTVARV